MTLSAGISGALLLDYIFGELKKYHPLVAFGALAGMMEKILRRTPLPAAVQGGIAWALMVLPPTFSFCLLAMHLDFIGQFVLSVGILYFCLGRRSLEEHASSIAVALEQGSLDTARQRLGLIVSRDTEHLSLQSVASATVESVLENGSDAVIASLIWFVLTGPAGTLAHRLANTLDAMWGYRSDQYRQFGFIAAKTDDVLNWLPARWCALGYVLAGRSSTAIKCWRTQAREWDSPNAGVVIAAGAGSLALVCGGETRYGGSPRARPVLGAGAIPQPCDIKRACILVNRVAVMTLSVVVIVDFMLWI